MIKSAFRIAVMTRLSSKSFNLMGSETLGISEVQDQSSPYYGRIPIPPLLDAQIDFLWMAMMDKLKKPVLAELKRKMMGRKREHWYEIFIVTLILLANLEFVYENQNRQLERYCEEVSFVIGLRIPDA